MSETIELTPNYENMFAGFSRELEPFARSLRKTAPEAFHRFMSAMTMSIQCATTVENINRLREICSRILTDCSKDADRRERCTCGEAHSDRLPGVPKCSYCTEGVR